MKILYFILFLLAVFGVLFGLNKLIVKAAYEKKKRYLHCRLIVAVALMEFVLVNVFTFTNLLTLINNIINSQIVSGILDMILPNRVFYLVYMLLVLLIINLAVTIAVLLTVWITKLIFKRKRKFIDIDDYYGFSRLLHFPWIAANHFYQYEDDEITLTNKGVVMGIWAKGLKRAFLLLWAVEVIVMAYSILWGGEDWNRFVYSVSNSWYFLPMAAFLLTEQIQLFLEADISHEAGTLSSCDVDITLCRNDNLVRLYEEIFVNSGVILYSEDGKDQHGESDSIYNNDLGNNQLEDCRYPEILSVISNRLRESGIRQCNSYQNALVALLNGHSINIRDNTTGEALIYIAAYLNYYVSQGKTALVLCNDESEAVHVREAMIKKLELLNNLCSVWDLSTIEDADNNRPINVLVCSYSDFITRNIFNKRKDFINDLFCTVITDGLGLFSQDSVQIELLFNTLKSVKMMKQYIMISDENNDDLRTALENCINHEVQPFANNIRHPHTGIMIWKEESYYKLQRLIGIGSSKTYYIGTALPLALVAVKYDVPFVNIIPSPDRGDSSYCDIQTENGNEIYNFVGRKNDLKALIRYNEDEVISRGDQSIIIIYDENYNFFQALWKWMKYGNENGTLFHVISPAYMLREYFAANFTKKQFILKNSEFNAFVPNSTALKISRMAVMLVSLCEKGLTEEELMEKSAEYRWNYGNIEELLTDCLKIVFKDNEIHNIYERFHFEEKKPYKNEIDGYVPVTCVKTTDEVIKKRIMDSISCANLIYNDGQSMKLSILRSNVYNYYLPGQFAVFDGYRYRIDSISDDGNIHAAQMNSQYLPQYYPISEFTFENYGVTQSCIDTGEISMNLACATVTRHIYGYLSCNNGNNFADTDNFTINSLRDMDGNELVTTLKSVNILEININKTILKGKAEQAAALLAYMLGEVFKTLFPNNFQNIYAVVSEKWEEGFIPSLIKNGTASPAENIIRSVIPCCNIGSRDSNTESIYIIEYSGVEFGFIRTIYQKYIDVFTILQDYLSWYLGKEEDAADGTAPGKYLNFGSDEISSLFAPNELLELLTKIIPNYEKAAPGEVEDITKFAKICSFCKKPTLNPFQLSDGRLMCGYCHNHQISQRDEIRTLFTDMVRLMEESYNIKFRKNIHVRFKTASEIKAAASDEGGRVLGFYEHSKKELWLEARGPRTAMESTLAHELTHSWQFDELDIAMLKKRIGNDKMIKLLEGHAKFVEIDVMRRKNEIESADNMHRLLLTDKSIYGEGYRFVISQLPGMIAEGSHVTPFEAMKRLTQQLLEGKAVMK